MSLIKFNQNRLFPWDNGFKNLLASDFFNTDFFGREGLAPALNVMEEDDDFEIELAAPGLEKRDFEITLDDDNMLTVSAEKRDEEEEQEENYWRREFSYNSFRRSIKLPGSVDANKKIKATYKNGILKINLLKKEEAKRLPKKVIEIA